ncbi:ATP-binding response regulator [Dictyobacter arantiisoli]|uniref:Histidine kinase n=1 Tax=Dictyobacter arantiisoli TaxID=2014874 RepID=A0A5A5TE29_9CHLR|nr:response regulator [Dictyobacter arantiisoli]GCF09259.1 hypothetical protein KDI_28230 [Dictyobacter arantiisoli]
MNETTPPFDENELTDEDLEILKSFDAIESWSEPTSLSSSTTPQPADTSTTVEQDETLEMLLVFLEEANEDIAKIRQALNQILQQPQPSPTRFTSFQRAGHKLRGTAGAVGYNTMSIAAEHIETIAEQVQQGRVQPETGLEAISRALVVLDHCHQYLSEEGHEPEAPDMIANLEAYYITLDIDITQSSSSDTGPLSVQGTYTTADQARITRHLSHSESTAKLDTHKTTSQTNSAIKPPAREDENTAFIQIEARRFEQFLNHTRELFNLKAALDNAQQNVTIALQEQQVALVRLQQLEQPLTNQLQAEHPLPVEDTFNSSSLIARILSTADPETLRNSKQKQRLRPPFVQAEHSWDELDMERYTEKDLLSRSLREAIMQVTACANRVTLATTELQALQQEYQAHVAFVYNDTRQMRLTPLSVIIPGLQQIIAESVLARQYQVAVEFAGDQLEIDQAILEILAPTLQQMLHICTSDSSVIQEEQQELYRIWFQAHGNGELITIEIGFSMPVLGGALEVLQTMVQKLNGSLNPQRNASGGVSFHLSFPRTYGGVKSLIVRIDDQQFIVPIAQIQRVGLQGQESCDQNYQLKELIDFADSSTVNSATNSPRPLLIMQSQATRKTVGIVVDEIIGEAEMMVKPLANILQRPGISESAIDGQGNVLFMIDLSEALRYYMKQAATHNLTARQEGMRPAQPRRSSNTMAKILIADDSASHRQAIIRTLKQERYAIAEARDGMEAIEQLMENTPDIFLLDIEMPNLNGYDVLNIIHEYPELAHIQTIMLTSRTSEKHMQRALELGAQAYLTKPCSQELLLATIHKLLARPS